MSRVHVGNHSDEISAFTRHLAVEASVTYMMSWTRKYALRRIDTRGSPGFPLLPGRIPRQTIQKLTASSNIEKEGQDWDRRVQTMRGNLMEHFVAGARRYLDKKYPTHGPFGARNRDRFFLKVEQGLKVRNSHVMIH